MSDSAPAPQLVNVTIDGAPYAFPKGTLLVDAVRQVGHPVPFYCYHQKLKPAGACRVCMVQMESPRGPMIVTSCTTPVGEGMQIQTMSDGAREARRQVLEFLLINHPLDCPICDKGGECDLQDFTLRYGPGVSRFAEPKIHRMKAHELGPFLVLDQERCILCQRCVRYEDEVLGEQNLVLHGRGDGTVIDTARGEPYAGHFSGNNTELCPVGALTSQTYRFKARPWDLRPTPSVCQGCSLGCNITVQRRGEEIVRLLARENAAVDGGWLCDRGRYGFGTVRVETRLNVPQVRREGQLVATSWEAAIDAVRQGLTVHGQKGIAVLGGARLTDEEAYLLGRLTRAVLRTNDLDWRTGAQGFAAPEAIGCRPAQVTDIDTADLVVVVDTPVGEEAPVLDLRLRRAGRRAQIVDVGPERSVAVGRVERIACAPEDLAERVQGLAARIEAAKSPLVVWNGRGGGALAHAVAGLGAPLLVPGEFANARGAEAAGLLPDLLPGYRSFADAAEVSEAWGGGSLPVKPGRATAAILEAAARGDLGVLYLVGSNPLGTFPDGTLAAQALDRIPFLVVQDLFPTDAAAHADVILPALGPFEKNGHVTNLAGVRQQVRAVAAGPAGARSDLDIFVALAAAFGAVLPGTPAAVALEQEALGPAKQPALVRIPEDTTPRPQEIDGLRLLVRSQLYAGGGTAAFDPNLRVVRGEPHLRICSADATALGLCSGQFVIAEGDGTSMRAVIELDDGLEPGYVAFGAHTPGANRMGQRVRLVSAGENGLRSTAAVAAMGVNRR